MGCVCYTCEPLDLWKNLLLLLILLTARGYWVNVYLLRAILRDL